MKTKLFALAAIVLSASLFGAYNGHAQDAPAADDIGEQSLLVLACNRATGLATKEGLTVVWCRRVGESIRGYQASVSVMVKIETLGKYVVTVTFQKSLWWAQDFNVEPV